MAYETTHSTGIEQFLVSVRYPNEIYSECKTREDFLNFVPAGEVIGTGLTSILLSTLKTMGMNLYNIKGLSTL